MGPGILAGIEVAHTVVVVGHGAEAVAAALPEGVTTCVQEEQRGTGHATGVGLAALPDACDTVLVVCGDTPLLSTELFVDLVAQHAAGGARGHDGHDGAAGRRRLRPGRPRCRRRGRAGRRGARCLRGRARRSARSTPGIFLFDRAALTAALGRVGSSNAQGEIYLPDVLPLLGGAVQTLVTADADVVLGSQHPRRPGGL